MKTTILALCATMALLSGCAESVRHSASTRPDLSGQWSFEVPTGRNVTHGSMALVPDGGAYRGTLSTDQGNNVLPVRSVILDGSTMNMIVDSPQGKVVFTGMLHPSGNSFEGKVTYHTGDTFPMSGRKLPPQETK